MSHRPRKYPVNAILHTSQNFTNFALRHYRAYFIIYKNV